VHIAGAFHLAGYRHVIAAMWPVLDGVAAEVAQQVYMMLRPGDTTVNNTAAILHHAVGEVRSYYPDEPIVWASFAHIGP
jgi:CHAT domain-containing protein